jgi:alkanesulfonate monooxygenase SsuD/methylene tetrahydromethanopterin reductase-like flavin-dependent oxidoreductase (luciferase family)
MNEIRVSFDLRAPAFGAPSSEVFATALDMAAYADTQGFDGIEMQEHHSCEDGYLPQPFLMGCAVAGRTRRIPITLAAVLLPLHDPVAVAEQIAVADLISSGRINVVLGAGYADQDLSAFGVTQGDRGRLMDEGYEVITRALAGERFTWKGRPVCVRPLPMSRPPRVFGGGAAPAAARRAARFGLGFYPFSENAIAAYKAECRRLGREPGPTMVLPRNVHVYEDPEEGWAEIGENLLYYVSSYAEFAGALESPMRGIADVAALRTTGLADIITPDQAVELARSHPLWLLPLQGGIRPEIGWKGLELVAEKVLPRIKAMRAAG